MKKDQVIQFAPTPEFAKIGENIQTGTVLTISTGFCFVEMQNTKKIEIVDRNCIIQ